MDPGSGCIIKQLYSLKTIKAIILTPLPDNSIMYSFCNSLYSYIVAKYYNIVTTAYRSNFKPVFACALLFATIA